MRLWMKWMRRKRLESHLMDVSCKSLKAYPPPYVYWPFVKGTSVDERKREWYILDRDRQTVLENDP